jgi:hypothetical protein
MISGTSPLLWKFERRVINVIVIIMAGDISTGFDLSDQLLIRFLAFIRY